MSICLIEIFTSLQLYADPYGYQPYRWIRYAALVRVRSIGPGGWKPTRNLDRLRLLADLGVVERSVDQIDGALEPYRLLSCLDVNYFDHHQAPA